jgi:hypothetical protein
MRRALALGVALFALIGAGFLWTRDRPVATALEAPPAAEVPLDEAEALVAPVSDVTPAQREARRFSRADRDHDDRIDRDEFLASRRKAFARQDLNGDGRLDFDEYAASGTKKFRKADGDGDGGLAAAEFATTAAKRREKPVCNCAGGQQ